MLAGLGVSQWRAMERVSGQLRLLLDWESEGELDRFRVKSRDGEAGGVGLRPERPSKAEECWCVMLKAAESWKSSAGAARPVPGLLGS